MIDPTFLAAQRRLFRSQDLLAWVQLEQLTPQWWLDQTAMAEELGTTRKTLSLSLKRLEERDLIRVYACGNRGTWVWWVKRNAADRPNPNRQAPAWIVRDVQLNLTERIRLGHESEWAKNKEITYSTLRSMLNGHHKLLYNRYTLVRGPYDCKDL